VAGNNTSITFSGQTVVNNSGVGQASSSFIYASEIVTGSTCTFNLAQYAQSTIPTMSVGNSAVWWYVLMNTAGTGYQAAATEISGNPTIKINKCSSGNCSTNLASCGNSWAVGSSNTWKFQSSGNTSAVTLTIYYNGTSICTYTDSSSPIITGYPGVGVNDNGSPVTTVASFQAD
jgi:hypothetical protein